MNIATALVTRCATDHSAFVVYVDRDGDVRERQIPATHDHEPFVDRIIEAGALEVWVLEAGETAFELVWSPLALAA